VRDVAFSPDGKTLLTASFDRTARSWDLPTAVEGSPEQIIALVQGLTGKQLDNDGMFRDLDASTWQQRRQTRDEVSDSP
jgi:WD40 repeat protein